MVVTCMTAILDNAARPKRHREQHV